MECWLKQSTFRAPLQSDFWRASPEGLLYLVKGYMEDLAIWVQDERYPLPLPGTEFYVENPMWQVGEVLLHAGQMARQLSDSPITLRVQFRWEGLGGRYLAPALGRGGIFMRRRVSQLTAITSPLISIASTEIRSTLAETVATLTKPLYRAFDFYEVEIGAIQAELQRLLKVAS